MKTFVWAFMFVVGLIISTVGFAQTPSFDTVIDWMYSQGLTKYSRIADFRPADSITRGEAAKFVDEYASLQNLPKDYAKCNFTDIDGYDSTLTPHIKQACFYGLLKGSNGKYRPNAGITEAEAITVVMRSVYGFFEETANPRWIAYYNRGQDLGLITDEGLREIGEAFISREKLGTWFYQAAQLNTGDGKFYSTNPGEAQYTKYSKNAFDSTIADGKQVALFFHAKWCPICHGTRDVINDGIEDGELPDDVIIFEVDFEDSEDLQAAYDVKAQTTFVFFDKNGKHEETSRGIYPEVIPKLLERFD